MSGPTGYRCGLCNAPLVSFCLLKLMTLWSESVVVGPVWRALWSTKIQLSDADTNATALQQQQSRDGGCGHKSGQHYKNALQATSSVRGALFFFSELSELAGIVSAIEVEVRQGQLCKLSDKFSRSVQASVQGPWLGPRASITRRWVL